MLCPTQYRPCPPATERVANPDNVPIITNDQRWPPVNPWLTQEPKDDER